MTDRLDRLLRPQSLAFIGGQAAELAIEASRSLGFSGQMWAVNPRRPLGGVPTFDSVDALPGTADAAFVGVRRDAAVEVVRALAAAGTGAAVCHASGFAESGETGAALQRDLIEAAAGMPIVGPNCYGTLSAVSGAALWPDEHGLARCERGVAILSQSGNIAVNLTMQRRALDVAWVMALGNQADVGVSEALEALVCDDAVTGVGLCIEGLDDVARFAAAADSARRRGLPVVALKLGASQSSAAIALTHTASLVGDDTGYDALFRRLGIRRVRTVPELLDTLAVMVDVGPLKGNRIVSLSCSGGEAVLVADSSRRLGLNFPELAPDHADRVSASLDGRVTVTNPLDYHTFIWGDATRLRACFEAVLCPQSDAADPPFDADAPFGADPPFDAALLVLDFPASGLDRTRWWPTLSAFAAACETSCTPGLVAASMAENLPSEARIRAAELGLASCGDLDGALSALEAAAVWGQHLARGESRPGGPVAPARGDSTHSRVLGEHAAKQRLSQAGVRVPNGAVVPAAEAASAAARIGCPVVVKVTSAAHKSDIGGVAAGLSSPEQAAAAAERLAGTGDREVLVEEFIADAVAELLVGVRSVPPVGMLLTVGAGGTLTELLDDTAALLLPAAAGEIREALRSLRVWALLAGHRGSPAGAVDRAVGAISALCSLVRDDSTIIEAEINPLIVTPHCAVAVDALMLVDERLAHG